MKTNLPVSDSPKLPSHDSLHHRLLHVKAADGNPVDLYNELLFFLDDPPDNTANRWQAGADLCAEHGIVASRMAVWRLYRDHIVEWRREQNPPPPEPAPSEKEIARLEAHARHLAAQRMIEMLNDPDLTPSELIGIVRNQLRSQQVEISRDHYFERVTNRLNREEIEREDRLEKKRKRDADTESAKRIAAGILAYSGYNTSSHKFSPTKPKPPGHGSLRSPTEGGEKPSQGPKA